MLAYGGFLTTPVYFVPLGAPLLYPTPHIVGISGNGRRLVGDAGGFPARYFGKTWTMLSTLYQGTATAANTDGSVVCGQINDPTSGHIRGFKSVNGLAGIRVLRQAPYSTDEIVNDVSPDGIYAIGTSVQLGAAVQWELGDPDTATMLAKWSSVSMEGGVGRDSAGRNWGYSDGLSAQMFWPGAPAKIQNSVFNPVPDSQAPQGCTPSGKFLFGATTVTPGGGGATDQYGFIYDTDSGLSECFRAWSAGAYQDTSVLDMSQVGNQPDVVVGSFDYPGYGPRAYFRSATSKGSVGSVPLTALGNWLSAQGVSMTGWTLTSAEAVSDNGLIITGNGIHNGVVEPYAVMFADPVAGSNSYSVPGSLIIGAPGVMTNDDYCLGYDCELVSTTTKGILVLNADGGFVYIRGLLQSGTDSFTYRLTRNGVVSNTTTVTLNLQ